MGTHLSFISRGYFNHTFRDYIKPSFFTVVGSKGSIRWCRLSEPSVRTFFGVEKLGLNKYNYWSVNLGRKRDSPETMARYLSIQQKQLGWCWNFSETTHLNHEKITTQLYNVIYREYFRKTTIRIPHFQLPNAKREGWFLPPEKLIKLGGL